MNRWQQKHATFSCPHQYENRNTEMKQECEFVDILEYAYELYVYITLD